LSPRLDETQQQEEEEIQSGEEAGATTLSSPVSKQPKWIEINVGMYLVVAKKGEKNQNMSSIWVAAMDKTIGKAGIVKDLDLHSKLVLLKFYDGDTCASEEWW